MSKLNKAGNGGKHSTTAPSAKKQLKKLRNVLGTFKVLNTPDDAINGLERIFNRSQVHTNSENEREENLFLYVGLRDLIAGVAQL